MHACHLDRSLHAVWAIELETPSLIAMSMLTFIFDSHKNVNICIRNYVMESTTRVLQIRNGNFNLACASCSCYNVITEDTLEPCHLHLVLSTSLIALALAAVNITS